MRQERGTATARQAPSTLEARLGNAGLVMFENGRIIQRDHIRAEDSVFIGLVKIDDRLSAMRQALSEHTKDGPRAKDPGRYSFHVDAAVSAHGNAGIGVVYQPRHRHWPSPWIAKGYRIAGIKDRNDAESWAIWHVLEMIIEKAGADRAHVKSQDPP